MYLIELILKVSVLSVISLKYFFIIVFFQLAINFNPISVKIAKSFLSFIYNTSKKFYIVKSVNSLSNFIYNH